MPTIEATYPMTYGKKAPIDEQGNPDYTQQRFMRMMHLAQWHHDASIAEFDDGMVIDYPNGWEHWLISGEFGANVTYDDALTATAYFQRVIEALGCKDRKEVHHRILWMNQIVDDEWLAEYAKRNGMTVDEARADTTAARKAAATIDPSLNRGKKYVTYDFDGIDLHEVECADPVVHDSSASFENIRARIRARHNR